MAREPFRTRAEMPTGRRGAGTGRDASSSAGCARARCRGLCPRPRSARRRGVATASKLERRVTGRGHACPTVANGCGPVAPAGALALADRAERRVVVRAGLPRPRIDTEPEALFDDQAVRDVVDHGSPP